MHDSEPKSHHLTAHIYLQYFSRDKENVYRYDKITKEIKPLPIGGVGAVNNYYTLYHNGVRDTFIENPFLSGIDGTYRSLMKKLRSQLPRNTSKDELIRLVSMQYARVEPQRDRFKRIVNDYNDQSKALGQLNKDLWPVDRNRLNNFLNQIMLIEGGLHAELITKSAFFAVFISSEHEFITCDNPSDKSFLPLAGDRCLMMPSKPYPQEYTSIPRYLVDKINQMTFDKSKRWVYGKSIDVLRQVVSAVEQ